MKFSWHGTEIWYWSHASIWNWKLGWSGKGGGVEKLQLAEVGPQAKFLTAPLPPPTRHFP